MSKRSSRLRPVGRVKTATKLALSVAATTLAGLVTVLIIVFNVSKQEISMAESPMVFTTADVMQDTTTVLRGSINRQVLGLVIETSGTGSPIKLSSIAFSANGTSEPVSKNVANARLWYSGKEKNFNTSTQIGSTISEINSAVFEVNTNKVLNAGKNYFWLTFDVREDATVRNGTIDAECISLRIGTNNFLPMTSAPPGKKLIAVNAPYFSTGNLAVNEVTSWNSKRDGSGIAPSKTDDILNSYFVQSGHRMTSVKICKLPYVIIEKGALLTAFEPVYAKTLLVTDGGTYRQDFAKTDAYTVENFRLENNANYIHNNTGILPSQNCNFCPRSNECFFQYGPATFASFIKWGNILINSNSECNLEIKNNFREVGGDFEIRKTGLNSYIYAATDDSLNVSGSIIMAGGLFEGAKHQTHLTINIGNDLVIKSGNFIDGDGNKNASTSLNIGGDVLLMNGIFDFNKNPDGKSEINLTDTKEKTVYWMQKGGSITLGNTTIMNGKEVILKSGKMGDIAAGRTICVKKGGKLMCGNSPVTGDGKFQLDENATLGIGSVNGINSIDLIGNILTKERYFDSGANYIYHTSSSPQSIGNFITTPVANTVKSITIKKENPADEVVLQNDMNVTDRVLISMGDFNKGKNKVNIIKVSGNKSSLVNN